MFLELLCQLQVAERPRFCLPGFRLQGRLGFSKVLFDPNISPESDIHDSNNISYRRTYFLSTIKD